MRHIFNKFYRKPTINLHDIKSLCSGLFYVKIITKACGYINVKSELKKGVLV